MFRAYETDKRESKRARRARESVLGRDAKRRRGVGDLVGGVREGVAGIGDPRARRVAVGREGARPVAPGNVEGGAAGVRDAHEGGDASLGGDAPRGDAASGGDGHVVSRGGGGCAAELEFGGEEDVGDASVALAVGAGDVVGVLAAGLGDEAGDGGGHGIGEVRRGEEGAHERVRGGEGRTPEQGDAEQGDARARLRLSSRSSRAVVVGVVVFPRLLRAIAPTDAFGDGAEGRGRRAVRGRERRAHAMRDDDTHGTVRCARDRAVVTSARGEV